MGKPHGGSSPDPSIEITVHPRRGNGGNPRTRSVPPPSSYQPYKKWFPWFVPLTVLINVGLLILTMYINNCPATHLEGDRCLGESYLGRFAFQPLNRNPLLGPQASILEQMGALTTRKVVENGEVWRLVTCMWLHAGVFHLLANMISLLFVGIRLEQEFGFVRIGLLYLLAGLGGSIPSALFVRQSVSVGASGALFGLLGAMLSELFINWTIYENKISAMFTLVLIILLNLAVGVLPHVDNFAHVGGFITGFLLGFVLLIRPQYGYVSQRKIPVGYSVPSTKSKYMAYQYIFLLCSLIVLIAGFTTGLVLLLNGVDGNRYCSWCHYLSCVPLLTNTCDSEIDNKGPCNAQCKTSQLGLQLNMTCDANQRESTYTLTQGNNMPELEKLCLQLCCDQS